MPRQSIGLALTLCARDSFNYLDHIWSSEFSVSAHATLHNESNKVCVALQSWDDLIWQSKDVI